MPAQQQHLRQPVVLKSPVAQPKGSHIGPHILFTDNNASTVAIVNLLATLLSMHTCFLS